WAYKTPEVDVAAIIRSTLRRYSHAGVASPRQLYAHLYAHSLVMVNKHAVASLGPPPTWCSPRFWPGFPAHDGVRGPGRRRRAEARVDGVERAAEGRHRGGYVEV